VLDEPLEVTVPSAQRGYLDLQRVGRSDGTLFELDARGWRSDRGEVDTAE
jgi:hypothetical protein